MPAAATTVLHPRPTTPIAAIAAITATLALAWAAPGARAQAAGGFTAPDDPAVPALISSLRGCIASLAAADRRVLALRAGLGGHAPQSTPQVAAALGVTAATANADEVGAIRKLESLRRRGVCQVQAATAPTTAAPTPTPTPTPNPTPAKAPAAKTTTKTTTSSGDSTTTLLEVAIPALLVLAFIAGIALETKRRPRGR